MDLARTSTFGSATRFRNGSALVLKEFAVSANYGSTTMKCVLIAAVPYLLFIDLDLII
jgi:hypothetical protein